MATRNEWSLNTVLMIAGAAGVLVLLILMAIAGFGFWASLLWGVIVAIIVALILIYGARGRAAPHDAGGGSATGAASAPAAPKPAPAPAPEPAAKPAPEPPAAAEPAPAPQPEPAPAPEPPAAAGPSAEPAAGGPEPAVKPSKPLPGQAELASQKGSWKYEGDGAAAPPAKPAAAAPGDAAGEGSKPEFLAAAREGGADDLKLIKGVGPKLEKMLNEMGIFHFDQVAAWSAEEVAWVDQNLKGFKGRVSRDNWVAQAKTLAEGGTTEFAARVKKGDVY